MLSQNKPNTWPMMVQKSKNHHGSKSSPLLMLSQGVGPGSSAEGHWPGLGGGVVIFSTEFKLRGT